MLTEWVASFQQEFATAVAYTAAALFISTVPFCIINRKWPELPGIVTMLLSSSGVVAGLKISLVALYLPDAQLGVLAGDKLMLLIGGLATLVLSLREATANWIKVANV